MYKKFDNNKTVLITGGAGFIGYFLSKRLLQYGTRVIGFDNLNDYYDVNLKKYRVNLLSENSTYEFVKGDLADRDAVEKVFIAKSPEIVVNLGAQAGVRYSIDCPETYIWSNLVGFFNILESCRHHKVEHLVYASSSSVYGANTKIPFSVEDKTDSPVSLYAATKKSNELMAYCYSKLYNIPSTGLRFFTVYGPMGRPDMAYFSFAQKIVRDEPIKVFNHGDMYRDFTYVDDIVTGIERLLCNPPKEDEHGVHHKVYNIGNNEPVKLIHFIEILEDLLGKKAVKEFYPMQPGDVYQTYADVDDLVRDFDFKPSTTLEVGLGEFVHWFREYYNLS